MRKECSVHDGTVQEKLQKMLNTSQNKGKAVLIVSEIKSTYLMTFNQSLILFIDQLIELFVRGNLYKDIVKRKTLRNSSFHLVLDVKQDLVERYQKISMTHRKKALPFPLFCIYHPPDSSLSSNPSANLFLSSVSQFLYTAVQQCARFYNFAPHLEEEHFHRCCTFKKYTLINTLQQF